jgi:hypothetical protein
MKTLGLLAVVLGISSSVAPSAHGQGLLTNKSVQKEIKATDEQLKKIDALARVLTKQRNVERVKLLRMEISREERRAKMRDLTWEIHDAEVKIMADFLKPEQVKRFEQITVQNAGLFAFGVPPVQRRLKLTEQQLANVTAIRDEAFKHEGSLAELEEKIDKEPELKKKWAVLEKQTMEKLVALMTDEQKATWKDLTGEPFEVSYPASATQ